MNATSSEALKFLKNSLADSQIPRNINQILAHNPPMICGTRSMSLVHFLHHFSMSLPPPFCHSSHVAFDESRNEMKKVL